MSVPAPVRIAVLGGGNRGSVYANWASAHPDRATVVAVAEPREEWREAFAKRHDLPADQTFRTWQELFDHSGDTAETRIADAIVVTTQDTDHVEPAIMAAQRGYHLLVEKPMAPNEQDCHRLVTAVEQSGVMLAVCHVMRYTPYTRLLKQVLDSGRIGDVVSIQHLEPVGFWHQAHSYVRGNWRREADSSSMLLAKSCHDIDWMRYIVGTPIERVSSFGSLTHFRPENRPEGAADRCLDCAIEPECAFSAKRLYLGMAERGQFNWPVTVLTSDHTVAGVRSALRDGPYGRCVYASDNDVVDHQVVALEFGGGITGTFTMTGFTPHGHRRTQIFGTKGSIDGDGENIAVYDFLTDSTEELSVAATGADAASGHGGGDAGLMDAFVAAVAADDPELISSGPSESLETHRAVFAAERSRHEGSVQSLAAVPAS